jgi:EmrB/QacA subfamily drug resistance transporter
MPVPVPARAPAAVTTAPRPAPGLPPGPGTPQPPAGPPGRRKWATLAVLCLSLLVIVIDTTIVNVALPTLARGLRPGTSGLQWIVDAYTLVFAAALLPAGSLGDRYGQHRSLAAGLAVFGTGSLGAALATSAGQLIVMRAVMGAGAAFIMPATMSVLTAVFTGPAERARAIGLWSAVSGLGVAIGPAAGGWLLQHYSWGSIFLVNLPIVTLALLAGHWLVPASPASRGRRLDLPGAALAAAGFAALTYTLIQAPDAGWASAATLLRAALTLGLLSALTAVELDSAHPMIQLALFRNSRFATASAAIMMMFFALTGVTFLLTQIYQLVLGYSALGAGLRALPSALALAVASPLGTRIARRAGTRLTVAAGLALTTAGLGYFATATAASGYPHYLIATMAMSAGIGLAMAPATTSIISALPSPMIGAGSATSNATRNLGSVLGVAVVGSIASSAYTSGILRSHQLSGSTAHIAARNLTSAITLARQLRGPSGRILTHTADQAFIHGTDRGVLTAALAPAAAAAAALRYLPRPARPAPAGNPDTSRRGPASAA